jgi:sugar O-acyltransferase (sialic acid O-acetyltransferase NeuD family)
MTTRNDPDGIFIFGASGHAKVVIDIVERQGLYRIVSLFDDDPALRGSTVFGITVAGGKEELLELHSRDPLRGGIVAIGDNAARAGVAGWLAARDFRLVSAVHPSAQLSRGVTVGLGTVIMAGVAINADATIGENVIVNTGATVDHDCQVGDCVHIAPGVTLCGTVRVGSGTFVGAGTTVIPNTVIGSRVMVGAGSTVVRQVPDGVQVLGTPAREVQRHR